ncbi:hypothetical protein, partial [Streptomyces harbinensis]|uniref:hypothetical protein n=1 Tax=Streptomyces harbinensis TaxID=1176198 RepID=UPI0034E03763
AGSPQDDPHPDPADADDGGGAADPDGERSDAGEPGGSEEAERDPEQDPDAAYRLTASEVALTIKAPLYHEDTRVAAGFCYGANATRVNLEELTAHSEAALGSMDYLPHDTHINYFHCNKPDVLGEGMTFDKNAFVGSIDDPDPTAEECYAAAHKSDVPNPITIEDILSDTSLHEGMGLCVETKERTVVLVWIDRVEAAPQNRDLRSYLTTATQWKPND